AEPGAGAHRALPVLLGLGRDQVERDDLLRDLERGEEGGSRAQRTPPAAAGEPRYRAGAEGRGERRDEGSTPVARPRRHGQARRAPSPRAVRSDGSVRTERKKAKGKRQKPLLPSSF